jgi:hypothetical protein
VPIVVGDDACLEDAAAGRPALVILGPGDGGGPMSVQMNNCAVAVGFALLLRAVKLRPSCNILRRICLTTHEPGSIDLALFAHMVARVLTPDRR